MSDGQDYIREQLGDLKREMESLSSQFRSLVASFNRSNTETLTRLTAIEGWQLSHDKLEASARETLDMQMQNRDDSRVRLEENLKKFTGQLDVLAKEREQVAGAGKVWKALVAAGTFVLVLLNILHLIGGTH
jgi:chromosome segregation ATPase